MQNFQIKDLVELAEYETQCAAETPWYAKYKGKPEELGDHLVGTEFVLGAKRHVEKGFEILANLGTERAVKQIARIAMEYPDLFFQRAIQTFERIASPAALREKIELSQPSPAETFRLIENITLPWALEKMARIAVDSKEVAPNVISILEERADPVTLAKVRVDLRNIALINTDLVERAVGLLVKAKTPGAVEEIANIAMGNSAFSSFILPALQNMDTELLKKASRSITPLARAQEAFSGFLPPAKKPKSRWHGSPYDAALTAGFAENATIEDRLKAIEALKPVQDTSRASKVLSIVETDRSCVSAAIASMKDTFSFAPKYMEKMVPMYPDDPGVVSMVFNAIVDFHDKPPSFKGKRKPSTYDWRRSGDGRRYNDGKKAFTTPAICVGLLSGIMKQATAVTDAQNLPQILPACDESVRQSLREMFGHMQRLHLTEEPVVQRFDEEVSVIPVAMGDVPVQAK